MRKVLKHLKSLEPIRMESSKDLLYLLHNTKEGKDLVAITNEWRPIHGTPIRIETYYKEITFGIEKVEGSNKFKLDIIGLPLDIIGLPLGSATQSNIEDIFLHTWRYLLCEVYGFNLDHFFKQWIRNDTCEAIGKRLKANDIYRKYNSLNDTWTLSGKEFNDPSWNLLKNGLGAKIRFYLGGRADVDPDDFNPRTEILKSFQIIIDPMRGTLKDLFIFLNHEENIGYAEDLSLLKAKFTLGNNTEPRSIGRADFIICAYNRKDLIGRIRNIFNGDLYVESDKSNKIIELSAAILNGNQYEIESIMKKIGAIIKGSNKSMEILASLRKNSPGYYCMLKLGISSDRLNLAADLGDVGF